MITITLVQFALGLCILMAAFTLIINAQVIDQVIDHVLSDSGYDSGVTKLTGMILMPFISIIILVVVLSYGIK